MFSLQCIFHIGPVRFLPCIHTLRFFPVKMTCVNIPHGVSEFIEVIEQVVCFLVEEGSHKTKEFSFQIVKVFKFV